MQEFKLPIKFYGQLANQPIVHDKGIVLLAIQTVNLSITGDQPIKLKGGDKFVITGSIATNVEGTCKNVSKVFLYSKPNPIAQTCDLIINYEYVINGSSLLVSSDDYINGELKDCATIPPPPKSLLSNTVYLNVLSPEITPLTVDLYIYGYIIN